MGKQHVRFAHLSDLHLSPKYYPERSLRLDNALRHAVAANVDHVIISGDITNQALPEEFEEFRRILLQHDLLDGKLVTVVPGNHDIFGGPYHAEDVLEFPSHCQRTDYERQFDLFHRKTKELFSNAEHLDAEHRFPFVKFLGPATVVIGLNSVTRWSPLKNPLGSNGLVDDVQFSLLESFLRSSGMEAKRIVIAVHHHFHKNRSDLPKTKLERLWSAIEDTTMKMRKKKRLLRLFSRTGVAAIFHGHVHTTEEYRRKAVLCFNAGGSIIPSRSGPTTFHLLTVSHKTIQAMSVPTVPDLAPVRRKKIGSPSIIVAA